MPTADHADDVTFALAVRRHVFVFSLAADELGMSETECRERWVQLESLWANESAAAEDVGMEMLVVPSSYNILTDESLKSRIDQIFNDVRASLPTMLPSEAEDGPVGASRPATAPAGHGRGRVGGRGGGAPSRSGSRADMQGRGRGRGAMFSDGVSGDESSDDEADEEDWRQSRHSIKGRGGSHVSAVAAHPRAVGAKAWVEEGDARLDIEEQSESESDGGDVVTAAMGPPAAAAAPAPSVAAWLPWAEIALAGEGELEEEAKPEHAGWVWGGVGPAQHHGRMVDLPGPATPTQAAERKNRVDLYLRLRGAPSGAEAPGVSPATISVFRPLYDDKLCAATAPSPAVLPPAALGSGAGGSGAGAQAGVYVCVESAAPAASAMDIGPALLSLFGWMQDGGVSPSHLCALQLHADAPGGPPRLVAAFNGLADAARARALVATGMASATVGESQELPDCILRLSSSPAALEPCVLPLTGGETGAPEDEPLPTSVLVLKDAMFERAAADGLAAVMRDLQSEGLDVAGARLVYVDERHTAALGLDSGCATGRVLALLVAGRDVFDRLQRLCGASDPRIARRLEPHSWRAAFGEDRQRSACATCRHITAGRRSAAFFFGGRESAIGEPVYYAIRSQSSYVLLVVSPACDTEPLLSRLARAGLTLDAAARLAARQLQSRLRLPAAAVGDAPTEGGLLVLLLSHGDALHRVEAAVAPLASPRPSISTQVPAAALDFLLRNADASRAITRATAPDLYAHLRFVLRNDML